MLLLSVSCFIFRDNSNLTLTAKALIVGRQGREHHNVLMLLVTGMASSALDLVLEFIFNTGRTS